MLTMWLSIVAISLCSFGYWIITAPETPPDPDAQWWEW